MLQNVEKLLNFKGVNLVYQVGEEFLVQNDNGVQDYIYRGFIIARVHRKSGQFTLIPDNGLEATVKRRREDYKKYFTGKGFREVVK